MLVKVRNADLFWRVPKSARPIARCNSNYSTAWPNRDGKREQLRRWNKGNAMNFGMLSQLFVVFPFRIHQ